MNSINPPTCLYLKSPVYWSGNIYALGRCPPEYDDHGHEKVPPMGKLFRYSFSSNDWMTFSMTEELYATNSVLTTYCSKLLLISGESMKVWEFSPSYRTFGESKIGHVPSPHKGCYSSFHATSRDENLIITYIPYSTKLSDISQAIFDGKRWRDSIVHVPEEMLPTAGPRARIATSFISTTFIGHTEFVVSNNSIALIEMSGSYSQPTMTVRKASLFNADHHIVWPSSWKEVTLTSNRLTELLVLLDTKAGSTLLHNNQLYVMNYTKGRIITSSIQPIMIPIHFGECNYRFNSPPLIMPLNENLLIIGNVRKTGKQVGEQLDVIKVIQKGKSCESHVHNYYIYPAYIGLAHFGTCISICGQQIHSHIPKESSES